MAGHQAVGQQPQIIERDGLSENSLERHKVLVSLEDGQPDVGPVEGVVDQAALRRSSWSWHALKIRDLERHVKNGS